MNVSKSANTQPERRFVCSKASSLQTAQVWECEAICELIFKKFYFHDWRNTMCVTVKTSCTSYNILHNVLIRCTRKYAFVIELLCATKNLPDAVEVDCWSSSIIVVFGTERTIGAGFWTESVQKKLTSHFKSVLVLEYGIAITIFLYVRDLSRNADGLLLVGKERITEKRLR